MPLFLRNMENIKKNIFCLEDALNSIFPELYGVSVDMNFQFSVHFEDHVKVKYI